jgi:hypothetical protein
VNVFYAASVMVAAAAVTITTDTAAVHEMAQTLPLPKRICVYYYH